LIGDSEDSFTRVLVGASVQIEHVARPKHEDRLDRPHRCAAALQNLRRLLPVCEIAEVRCIEVHARRAGKRCHVRLNPAENLARDLA
jgi:hypothetical protein